MLADAIVADNHFAQDAGAKLYRYVDEVYRPRAEEYVKGRVKALCTARALTKKWSSHLANEVAEFIRVDAPRLWDRPPVDRVNVKNGLVRVADKVLLPHSPDHLCAVQLPVHYDPAGTCPAIEAFVDQVFPADAHALAWEVPAWVMLPATAIQKAVLLVGEGANGKSTWLNLLITFLAKQNTAGVAKAAGGGPSRRSWRRSGRRLPLASHPD